MAIRDIGPLALQAAQQRAGIELEIANMRNAIQQANLNRINQNVQDLVARREQKKAERKARKRKNAVIAGSIVGGLVTAGLGSALASGTMDAAAAGTLTSTSGMAGDALVGYGVTGGTAAAAPATLGGAGIGSALGTGISQFANAYGESPAISNLAAGGRTLANNTMGSLGNLSNKIAALVGKAIQSRSSNKKEDEESTREQVKKAILQEIFGSNLDNYNYLPQ